MPREGSRREIPEDRLDEIRDELLSVVEWLRPKKANYVQDYGLLTDVKTFHDVFSFLIEVVKCKRFVEFAEIVDPLGQFRIDDYVRPEDRDEEEFRAYLVKKCGFSWADFPDYDAAER